MTMCKLLRLSYRGPLSLLMSFGGEAPNHGILDVKRRLDCHLAVLKGDSALREMQSTREACAAYEQEMVELTRAAVLASRQACLDAHEYRSIHGNPPLVSKIVNMTAV